MCQADSGYLFPSLGITIMLSELIEDIMADTGKVAICHNLVWGTENRRSFWGLLLCEIAGVIVNKLEVEIDCLWDR